MSRLMPIGVALQGGHLHDGDRDDEEGALEMHELKWQITQRFTKKDILSAAWILPLLNSHCFLHISSSYWAAVK